MFLESALNEDDEFTRLTKISQGCKIISQRMPFIDNFTDSNLIRLCNILNYSVFCCYPYQRDSIDMIIAMLIERFPNKEFLNAFYQALTQITQLNEVLQIIAGSKELQHHFSKRHSKKIMKPLNLNILVTKQFALKCLLPFFELTDQLGQPLESRASIFLMFLQNTTNEDLILEIMDAFQECKKCVFGSNNWVRRVEDSIEYSLYNKNAAVVQKVAEETVVSSDSSNNSVDPYALEEMSMPEQIELWIMQQETPLINDSIEYFRNADYLQIFNNFIFDPTMQNLHKQWQIDYPNLKNIDDSNCWKSTSKPIDKYYILRSYKALNIITNVNNFDLICKNVSHFLQKQFTLCYYYFVDTDRHGNLYHIAILMDFLLKESPRQSLYYIIENNLLFNLAFCLYNPFIQNIIEKILNILTDEYQLGIDVQEQAWNYIQSTEWVQYSLNLAVGQEVDYFKMDKNYKTEQIIQVLAQLQTHSKFDRLPTLIQTEIQQKQDLTELLGQMDPGKAPQDFYGTHQTNWNKYIDVPEYISVSELRVRDIDNIKQFVQQRNNTTITISQPRLLIKQPSIKVKENEQSFHKTKRNYVPTLKTSPDSQKWLNTSKSSGKTYMQHDQLKYQKQLKTQLSTSSTYRVRTEDSQYSFNNGFSSSRLRTIYPSYRTKICGSEFERKSQEFKIKDQISFGCACIIFKLIDSALYQLDNEEYLKKYHNRQILNFDLITKSLINKDTLYQYFQLYLYKIQAQKSELQSSALLCGDIINLIYINCLKINTIYQLKESVLKPQFIDCFDYLCKVMINIENSQPYLMPYKNKIQITLINTFNFGLKLLDTKELQEDNKYLFASLNETFLHIILLWFFDNYNKTICQQQFTQIMIFIFSKAPVSTLATVLFKLGFPISLYNARQNFIINDIKNMIGNENYYLYMKIQIFIIDYCLKYRNLDAMQQNLKLLECWKTLQLDLPERQKPFITDIIKEIQSTGPKSPSETKKSSKSIFRLRSYQNISDDPTLQLSKRDFNKRLSVQTGGKLTFKTLAKLAMPIKKQKKMMEIKESD